MKRMIPLLLMVGLAACDAIESVDVDPTGHRTGGWHRGPANVRVLTRNVYVGTDVDAVLAAASPQDIPVLAAQAYAGVIATDFNERARSLAREIARTRPHLVGLQEISLFRLQSPGDAIVGGSSPAETVTFDYLEILMNALAEFGQPYEVVATVQDTDVEVPMLSSTDPLSFDDVRLTDYDVILARRGVRISNAIGANYHARFTVPIGPTSIDIVRGYTAVTATVGTQRVRFVNTHLEPGADPPLTQLRLAQASELLAVLSAETDPVILVGDLNTPAPDGLTYQALLGAGFEDTWVNGPRGDREGFTCCHALDLLNAEANFDHRIDLVLVRGSSEQPEHRVLRTIVIGDEQRNRTASGLWPSDHGGVFSRLRILGRPPWSQLDGR